MRLRDLYPYSKAKLARASPLGEATGATRRNESLRDILRKYYKYLTQKLIEGKIDWNRLALTVLAQYNVRAAQLT